MFCTFCYKTIDSAHEKRRKGEQLLKRFVKFVQRYFGKNFGVRTDHLEKLRSCQDCNFLIESFCNLYNEIKCLELRMEWKVRKLLEVISAAERVPSRSRLAKEHFESQKQNNIGFEDVFEVICDFRKDFKSKCIEHLSNSLPKVDIPQLVKITRFSTTTKQETTVTEVSDQSRLRESDKLLLGWVSTLAGVFWLGFSCWENTSPANSAAAMISDIVELAASNISDNDDDNDCAISTKSTNSTSQVENQVIIQVAPIQPEVISASQSKIRKNITPQFACDLCPKVVHAKKMFQYHKLSAHTSRDQWPFSCTLCNRQFLSFYDFNKHNKSLRHQMRKSLTKVRKSNRSLKVPGNIHTRLILKIEVENTQTNEVKNEMDTSLLGTENIAGNLPVVAPENGSLYEERFLRPIRKSKMLLDKKESDSCSELEASSTTDSDENYSKKDSCSGTSESDCSPLSTRRFKRRQLSCICDSHGCSESFRLPEELAIHKKLHGSFLCKFCDTVESYAPKLGLHEMVHAESRADRKFQCARCPYWSTLESRYVNHHLRRHLKLSRRTFICTICKIPLTRTGRRAHMLSHHQTEGVDEASIHKCEQCSAFFLNKGQLLKHMTISHKSGSDVSSLSSDDDDDTSDSDLGNFYTCQTCHSPYIHASSLRNHEKKVHGATPPVKPKKSVPPPKRKPPLKRTKVPRPVTVRSFRKHICDSPNCRKGFELPEELDEHKKHHGTFPCSVCNVVETYAPKLALHELTHECALAEATQRKQRSTEKPNSRKTLPVLNCIRCPYNTKEKADYIEHHLGNHLDLPTRIVSCPICKWKTGYGNNLSKHFKSHHNTEGMASEEIAKCDKCPAYFRRYIQLFSHETKIHGEDPLKCVDCGRKLKHHESLQKHRIRVHKKKIEEFQFLCDVEGCGGDKRFETRRALEWHKVSTHAVGNKGGDIFICFQCGKRCSTEIALKNHMRVHDENRQRLLKEKRKERKYVCDSCGKPFLNQHILAVHKLAHSGPSSWKYCCLICDKKCQSEEKLDQHLRTHTREKPYFCQFCEEEYAHAHNLRNHMNKQHGANVVARKYNAVYLESRKGKKLAPRLI